MNEDFKKAKFSEEIKVNAGTLYDVNKDLVFQTEKAHKGKALSNLIKKTVVPYLDEKINTQREEFFMLLCHEQRDYTVFSMSNQRGLSIAQKCAEELKECLINRGYIYSIEKTNDGALEIWIRYKKDDSINCYFFFPYTSAVVLVK